MMVACLTSSVQVKQCPETFSFNENHWVPNKDYMQIFQRLPTELLQQVQSQLCHMQYSIIMDEKRTITKKTRMSSPDGLLQALQPDAVPTVINFTSMFHDVQQKDTQQVPEYEG